MHRPIPTKTLIRFPIVFGTFLIAGGVAFYHRKSFIESTDVERQAFVTEKEGEQMINTIKQKHKVLM